MNRRVAKKVSQRTMRAALEGDAAPIYRSSTLLRSARIMVRALPWNATRPRLPYVPPIVTERGQLGVLFRGTQ